MRTDEKEFIEKLGKIIEKPEKEFVRSEMTMVLLMPPDGMIYVESNYFTYSVMQKFMYLLSRTPCEWYIYPSKELENGVRLKIRLF